MADNEDHVFYYSSLSADMVGATTWNRLNNLDPTAINTSTTTTVTATTDVVVYDTDYATYCGYAWDGSGGTLIGLVTCVSLNSASECEKHEMRYDTSWTASRSTTWQRALACHESGHTLGLKHRDNTASDSGCLPDTQVAITHYSNHDLAHIANQYT